MYNGYIILKYDSWKQFKSDIYYDLVDMEKLPYRTFLFRGQSNESWTLKSSFDRLFGEYDFKTKNFIENNLINEFKKSCYDDLGINDIENYTDIQILSLGQHYGLPTRLLDWSYSLYIAVYFAYSNVNKSRENVVIWALNKDHIIWQNSDAVLFTEHRVKENNNQKNQMGIFTLNKSLYNDLEEYAKQSTLISNISKKDALYKIIIPAKDKEVVLADLEQMGINSVKMFKGFEGCAKTALEKTISTISSKKI
ncbi:FRG domain-containing protein [Thomasclavelia spiroformis]|jgi:hypothetical protein|uniref:FRG domain-containing protein n=1 Tax=Thomasclavelia spiroformis TaxID=29348 RepID=UPI00241C2691|nr:FRG domain-containing protein [Thomasclavelia spiroformis]